MGNTNFNHELYHWGVIGMKWGRRRYQNKDGSLTPLGEKRYAQDVDSNSRKKKDNRLPEEALKDPNRWAKEDTERTKGVIDASKRAVDDVRNASNTISNMKKRNAKPMDMSKMSDKEMRDRINRALLERQYDDMFNPKKVNNGRAAVEDVLSVAGGVLGVASSALAIALSIRQLKGG